ncbi:hypothetical protein OS493_004299 [Desmophyllum pertusum]|uniref:Uncharacterized protein n=1 Tax=Desmophyllum pertusum TaxID=174260 RepID=A0A9X0D570_9CNID|nr:hypothetical protein OS493_004299 [Desmophyllum pertusum]
MEDDTALAEIMNVLEAEPSSEQAGGVVSALTSATPDIPTGKAKQAIGVQLIHEQVKRLTDKDVEKYYKRYKTFVGAKTTENLIQGFLMIATKAVGMVVPIKDVEAMQKELQNDYIISKELSELAAKRFSRWYALLVTPFREECNEKRNNEYENDNHCLCDHNVDNEDDDRCPHCDQVIDEEYI